MANRKIRTFRPSRFWSNVTALRVEAGFTPVDTSRMIGQCDSYMTAAVTNGGVPNIETALKIADLFGTTVEELAYGAVGLEIRRTQLLAELEKLNDEINDVKKDTIKGEK